MLTNGRAFLRLTYLWMGREPSFSREFFRDDLGLRGHALGEDKVALLQRVFGLLQKQLGIVVGLFALVAERAVIHGPEHAARPVDRRLDCLGSAVGVRRLRRAKLRGRRHWRWRRRF